MSDSPEKSDKEPSRLELLAGGFEELWSALKALYIKGNQSGRIHFTKNWPVIADYIFQAELISYDTSGAADKERRDQLENEAEERYFGLLGLFDDLEENSVQSGVLQTEYVEKVVKTLGRPLSLLIYEQRIVNRFLPPTDEERAEEAAQAAEEEKQGTQDSTAPKMEDESNAIPDESEAVAMDEASSNMAETQIEDVPKRTEAQAMHKPDAPPPPPSIENEATAAAMPAAVPEPTQAIPAPSYSSETPAQISEPEQSAETQSATIDPAGQPSQNIAPNAAPTLPPQPESPAPTEPLQVQKGVLKMETKTQKTAASTPNTQGAPSSQSSLVQPVASPLITPNPVNIMPAPAQSTATPQPDAAEQKTTPDDAPPASNAEPEQTRDENTQ